MTGDALLVDRARRRHGAASWAGYRSARYARSTGTLVVVVDGADADLDTSGGRWSTICDDHGTAVAHATRALAEWHAVCPEDWCDGCRELPLKPTAR